MLYFPVAENTSVNAAALNFKHADQTLKIWKLEGTGDDALIYLGGNGEDVAHNIASFRNWFPERTVYLINYRGFGGSTGQPSETSLCGDALAFYDAIAERHDAISLMGRSLGSGVASYLAARREIEKLILITPFDNIVSVAKDLYPYLPVTLMMHERYDSASEATNIDSPVLLVIAEDDQVVAPKHALALAKAFPEEQIEVLSVPSAGHRNVSTYPEYKEAIKNFL